MKIPRFIALKNMPYNAPIMMDVIPSTLFQGNALYA